MNRRWILALLCLLLVLPSLAFGQGKVTLELLIHQNDPMVNYIASMNEKFQAKYPDFTATGFL